MNKAFSNFTWENDPSVNTPLSAENLNRVNRAVNEIDNRVINHDTTKANQTDLLTTVTNVTFDESTGKFTFTRHNGTTVVIDTKLEKLILNWRFDPVTQILYMVLEDGTETPVDLSAFITNVEFEDSDTIRVLISTEGKVAFEIIGGSITADKLEPNYLADIQLEASKAETSATSAAESAESAEASALRAEEAADIAQSVSQVDIATTTKAGIVKPDGTTITVDADGTIHGVGGGGDVTQEDLENYAFVLREKREVYVSPNGNDETGDGTQTNPWKTIKRAVEDAPILANNSDLNYTTSYYINLFNGTYDEGTIVVKHKSFGFKNAESNPDVLINGCIYMMHSFVEVRAKITFDITNTVYPAFTPAVCSTLHIRNNIIINGVTSKDGIAVLSTSRLWINNSITINNTDSAIRVAQGSVADISNIIASGCNVGIDVKGGIASYQIATFTSCANDITTAYGGRVFTGTQVDGLTVEKIEGIQTTSTGNLSRGWYRVAEYDSSGNALFGEEGNSCMFVIKQRYGSTSGGSYILLLNSVSNSQKIVALASNTTSNGILVSKARYTYDSDKAYLEIYYDNSTSNRIVCSVLFPSDNRATWKAITPTPTSETVDGVTVTTTYNIPANATPITTADKPSGTYTGNGSATKRTINTGGIGNMLLINRKDFTHFAIVTASGAIGIRTASDGQNMEYMTSSEANYVNGVLTLATTNGRVNVNGYTFEYHCL